MASTRGSGGTVAISLLTPDTVAYAVYPPTECPDTAIRSGSTCAAKLAVSGSFGSVIAVIISCDVERPVHRDDLAGVEGVGEQVDDGVARVIGGDDDVAVCGERLGQVWS